MRCRTEPRSGRACRRPTREFSPNLPHDFGIQEADQRMDLPAIASTPARRDRRTPCAYAWLIVMRTGRVRSDSRRACVASPTFGQGRRHRCRDFARLLRRSRQSKIHGAARTRRTAEQKVDLLHEAAQSSVTMFCRWRMVAEIIHSSQGSRRNLPTSRRPSIIARTVTITIKSNLGLYYEGVCLPG